jgi:hypothetical protein
MTRRSRPHPTGTHWPNRNRSTSSTSRCSGSRLPSPGRAGDAPRTAPVVIVPRHQAAPSHAPSPPGALPNGGLLPVDPVGSPYALAENLPSMLRSPDTSRRAVGFSRSGRQGREPWRMKVRLPSIARFGRLTYSLKFPGSENCPWARLLGPGVYAAVCANMGKPRQNAPYPRRRPPKNQETSDIHCSVR